VVSCQKLTYVCEGNRYVMIYVSLSEVANYVCVKGIYVSLRAIGVISNVIRT